MKNVSLIPYFALAFFYHLSMPFLGSFYPVLYFGPFFTTCYARKSLYVSLWTSFFIGLFLDLCATSTPLGFYPICCILTTLAIHRLKVYLSEDKPFVFAIYTGIYSLTYSLIFAFLHSFYDPKLKIFPLSFLIDSVFLPILDYSYHLTFFTLPILGYKYVIAREQKVKLLKIKKKISALVPALKRKFAR